MLNEWATMNYNEPVNISEILRQPLWDNDLILIDNQSTRNEAWAKVGIKHIANLINTNGQLSTINQLNNKFQINIKTLQYNSIIHSIPKAWKKQIKQNKHIAGTQIPDNPSIKILQIYYDIEEVTTKQIYTHIIENKCKSPTSEKRWTELYEDMNLGSEYWELIYETPSLLTKNSKVLNTQYKIINRIIAVGCNLKKWKITNSYECNDCKSKDTIEHFIFECPNTSQLWKSIQNWWKNLFLFSIQISSLEIIFGLPNETKDSMIHIYNFVILYAKHYIYTNKKMGKSLSLYEFHLQLKHELKLKKEYAKQQQNVHKFNITWGQLYDNL